MLNVYFGNKNEKTFQIDLNSDLKEKPNFKRWCCFTLVFTLALHYIYSSVMSETG